MNLEEICINLKLSKEYEDDTFKWLGCYSCDGHNTECTGYLSEKELKKYE